MKRISIATIVTITTLGLAVPSGPAFAERPGKGEPRNPARHYVAGHMQLGEYYLLLGQYEDALEHFEIIATLENKGRSGRATKGEEAANKGREVRKHKRQRGAKMRFRAHMGAAVAAHKAGKVELAQQWAERALEFAQARELRRAVKAAERFLEEPDEVASRRAPTVEELEKRLQMMESRRGERK